MGWQGPSPAGLADTGRHAKAQVSGTFRHLLAQADTALRRLITRRSQVQILPPPPTNMQVRGPPSGRASLRSVSSTGALPSRSRKRFEEAGEGSGGFGLHSGKHVLVGGHCESRRGVPEPGPGGRQPASPHGARAAAVRLGREGSAQMLDVFGASGGGAQRAEGEVGAAESERDEDEDEADGAEAPGRPSASCRPGRPGARGSPADVPVTAWVGEAASAGAASGNLIEW